MLSREQSNQLSTNEIQTKVIAVIQDLTSDWELDLDQEIGPDTRLVEDLAFESIDVVQLIIGLESTFNCKGLPFEKLLMQDDRYVDEILVSEIVDFLQHALA